MVSAGLCGDLGHSCRKEVSVISVSGGIYEISVSLPNGVIGKAHKSYFVIVFYGLHYFSVISAEY